MNPDSWNPCFDTLHPCFQQLQNVRCWDGLENWPACEQLAGLLPPNLQAQSGLPITFVPQDDTLPFPELYYEERIFQHGMVSTRPNWHDFFNALMWNVFPRSKVMINALHAADISRYGKPRTPQRDALTVLGRKWRAYCGEPPRLIAAGAGFRVGRRCFGKNSAAWGREIGCYMIGHATLEKDADTLRWRNRSCLIDRRSSRPFSSLIAGATARLFGWRGREDLATRWFGFHRLLEPVSAIGCAGVVG